VKEIAKLEVGLLSVAEAERIASWRYSGPYAVYDTPEERRADSVRYMLDPSNGFYAVRAAAELVGFCSFGVDVRVPGGSYDDGALDMGAGMDPGRIGQQLGCAFLGAAVDHGASQLNATTLRATIASWNHRALRAVHSVGFTPAAAFCTPRAIEFTILTRSSR
jgi:[ribosomal protein S18]-alanine N-acetyltransferase